MANSRTNTRNVDQRATWRLPADLWDYVYRRSKSSHMSLNAALVLIVSEHKAMLRSKSSIAEMDERLTRVEAVIYPKETKFVKLPRLPMGRRA